MELTFVQQSTAFLYSILLGTAFGIIYGPLKIIRLAFCSGKISVFLIDFFYMLIVSVTLFYFSVAYLLGYVRIYVFLGCLIGFSIYRLTLGRIFSKIYCPLIEVFRRLSHKIHLKIKNFTKKLLKIAYKILYNVSNKRSIFRNKRFNKAENKRVMASDEKRKCKGKKRKGTS